MDKMIGSCKSWAAHKHVSGQVSSCYGMMKPHPSIGGEGGGALEGKEGTQATAQPGQDSCWWWQEGMCVAAVAPHKACVHYRIREPWDLTLQAQFFGRKSDGNGSDLQE